MNYQRMRHTTHVTHHRRRRSTGFQRGRARRWRCGDSRRAADEGQHEAVPSAAGGEGRLRLRGDGRAHGAARDVRREASDGGGSVSFVND